MYFTSLFITFSIATFLHQMYLEVDRPKIFDKDRFTDGISAYHQQTLNDCLITEGYYDTKINYIHTPIGTWNVGGGSVMGTTKEFSQLENFIDGRMKEIITLEMLVPGYQTAQGFIGPFYVITSFKGKKICDLPKVKTLLPFSQDLDLWHGKNKELHKKILQPYLDQMQFFFKNRTAFIHYKISNSVYNEFLKMLVDNRVIKDKLNFRNCHLINEKIHFIDCLFQFLPYIDPSSSEYKYIKFIITVVANNYEKLFRLLYITNLQSPINVTYKDYENYCYV